MNREWERDPLALKKEKNVHRMLIFLHPFDIIPGSSISSLILEGNETN
jgi:hypothetical protein